MSTEWKPGDVVAWTVDAESYNSRDAMVALLDELILWWPSRPRDLVGVSAGTSALSFLKKALMGARVGGLVVIDPTDNEAVKRLGDAFCLARWDHISSDTECDPLTFSSMQDALREFAAPTPPKRVWTDGDVVQHRLLNFTAQRVRDDEWRTTAQREQKNSWGDDAYVTRGVEAGDFIVLREQAAEVQP